MGYSGTTVCRTCGKEAPWLADGDGAFIGRPSLSTEPLRFEGGEQNFGYLCAGFENLGFVNHELFLFREFLARHEGHDVVNVPDEVAGEVTGGSDTDDLLDDEVPEGWALAHLEVVCRACRKRRRSKSPDYFQLRPEFPISETAVEFFLERMVPVLPDNFHRVAPCGRRDLEALGGFIEKHRGHEMATRVVAPSDEPD